jgi:hypothetical protein
LFYSGDFAEFYAFCFEVVLAVGINQLSVAAKTYTVASKKNLFGF